MSEYKIVFRKTSDSPEPENQTKWERGCPLLFEAVQVSRNTETGQAFLQARAKNISAEEVSSFTAKLFCAFSDGSTAEFAANPLDADILPWCDYTLAPIELPRGDAESADVRVLSATSPTSGWASSLEPAALPQRKPLDLSDEALSERRLQLDQLGCAQPEEAAPFGIEEHGSWTLCACGQPSIGHAICPACQLPFEPDVSLEDGQRLESLARERSERQFRKEREAQKRVQSRNARMARASLIVAALLAVIATSLALKFVMLDMPEKARQEASDAVAGLMSSGGNTTEDISKVIDEHYQDMTEEDKQYCLKLLGLNLCGDEAWNKYAPSNAVSGSFAGSFEEDGDWLVGSICLSGDLLPEDGGSNAQQFSVTCSAKYRIDVESGTARIGDVSLEYSTLH